MANLDHRARMAAGLPYKSWKDGLPEDRLRAKKLIHRFNNLPPDEASEIVALLKELLGKTGEQVYIEAPFRCDYGYNIEVGENFFANYGLTVLDVGKVRIGKYAQLAPNVAIYTATHPVHPEPRNSGYELGLDVTIGDNVVVGAGSVVTRDLPDNVVAVGNPCRVLREITDEDRHCYHRDLRFDVDDYLTPGPPFYAGE